METIIDQYFREEKAGALILAIVGVIAISLGIYLLFRLSDNTLKGMAYPLLIFGLIQLSIGAGVYLRTDKQVHALHTRYRQVPQTFKQEESARMAIVMRNFRMIKVTEIVFIALGIVLIMVVSKPLWIGVGIGMLFQAAFLLGFDKIAEQRGEKYRVAVEKVV